MVSTYSESRLSRLAGFIRSPFRPAPSPTSDPDWYVPYNGPIERPKSSYAFLHDPFERGRSTISSSILSPSLQAESSNRDAQSLRTSGSQRVTSSRRSSKSQAKAPPSFISLDTGGIGQSPAPVANAPPPQRQRESNRSQKEQSPPRDIGAYYHPYNPHGIAVFASRNSDLHRLTSALPYLTVQ
ncbi:hypothetical protein BS47DRAFT_472740 [Hydnum rufescens UP504]|uniref:Uncharacterized protein n=1 Tax=Hydnum rufescens UP504 TaxID=1448309 RepID=A0A9P6B5A6_9AGAM|nr:hypothetical protein BS47DRAFT_472740 [Hydnum rufescens UP504]